MSAPADADHIDRYDRQIRAWGLQTQQKLRRTEFLLVGMTDTALEVAKNLILAGANTVTFAKADTANPYLQFVQGLNPQCSVVVADAEVPADVVCVFDQPEEDVKAIRDRVSGAAPIVVVKNSQADLVFGASETGDGPAAAACIDALHQSVFGALVAELIIRWLPPLETALALRMSYDAGAMQAAVEKLL